MRENQKKGKKKILQETISNIEYSPHSLRNCWNPILHRMNIVPIPENIAPKRKKNSLPIIFSSFVCFL